mmetsp:Transcript_8562/g.24574  ORF Transcript_8562/g.24574 Transcript_8562/m.24574 type:complete len:349 (+) Transcript_8562:119-1165(+)
MACIFCQLALGAAPLAMWALRGKPALNPSGKHVLITGGSDGLGLSLAEEWRKYGATVSLVSRSEAKLAAAKESLEKKFSSSLGRVATFAADTTKLDELESAISAAEQHNGPISILICNAGFSKPGYFVEQPIEEFERVMQVNYFGTVHTVKVVAPKMLARKEGHICIIGSGLCLVGFTGFSAYAPTKWALRGLADCLRNEFVGTGVSVSIAYPPDTDTPGYKTEMETKPPECLKISEGEALLPANKVAKHIVSSIRQGKYHIPAPDMGQEMLVAKMAGISPMPGSAILNFLLAPILVLVAMFYTSSWDSIVKSFAKQRPAWKSVLRASEGSAGNKPSDSSPTSVLPKD